MPGPLPHFDAEAIRSVVDLSTCIEALRGGVQGTRGITPPVSGLVG
ncbi:MAG: hypothetical protein Ct9H300mP31_00370 [Acidimicrobiaceae bacterium]|nr:MAG: hypothetical protein Ct9H300mP31_00370 [Acidimicrobiaceae bacterium]